MRHKGSVLVLSSLNERERGQSTRESFGRKGAPRPARVTRRSRSACLRLSEANGLVNAVVTVLMQGGVSTPAEAGAVRRALVGAVCAGAGRALLLNALRGRLKEAIGRMLDAAGADEPAARLRDFVGGGV